MADLEKTMLDLLYFNTKLTTAADYEGLRLERTTLRERLSYMTTAGSPRTSFSTISASPSRSSRKWAT